MDETYEFLLQDTEQENGSTIREQDDHHITASFVKVSYWKIYGVADIIFKDRSIKNLVNNCLGFGYVHVPIHGMIGSLMNLSYSRKRINHTQESYFFLKIICNWKYLQSSNYSWLSHKTIHTSLLTHSNTKFILSVSWSDGPLTKNHHHGYECHQQQ